MKYLLKGFLLLSILFIGSAIHAQPSGKSKWKGTIEGTVKDSSRNTPLMFATIRLLKEGKYINGVTTNEKGKFLLDTVSPGTYNIQIDYMGYNTKTIKGILMSPKENILIKKLGTILLSPKGNTTGTVTVTKKKEVIVNEIDKKVFNADKNITSSGGTARDLIENVPSVEVDQDGNISLRGNANVIILIDGRPSGLTGAGRQAFLESIPASSIERIEIITNPSAKYDPDGMSGIINIVLKKNKMKGSNGMVSASLGTNHNYNFATQLGYRTNKVNIFGNYSLNANTSNRIRNYDKITYANNEYLDQNAYSNEQGMDHLIKIGADFYINKLNTLYFTANTGFGGEDENNRGFYNYTFPSANYAYSNRRLSSEEDLKRSYDVNLGFNRKYNKKNHELNIDLFFTNSNRDKIENLEIANYDTTLAEFQEDLYFQNLESNNSRENYSFKLDYTKPLKGNIKFETGTKIDLRNLNNVFYVETTDTGTTTFIPDAQLNNTFDYRENILAAYGILGKSIKNFGIQAGLRVEQALTSSEVIQSTDGPVKNNYFSLFPSAHIKYEYSESKTLMLSYSRRVNRPRTRQLNPFANSTDPEKVFTGNPYLKPEYISSYELGYSYYKKMFNLTASVYWKHLTNMISRIKTTDSTGRNAVTYDNFDESNSYGVELIAIVRPTKNWDITLSGNANASVFTPNADQLEFDNSSFKWNVRMINSYAVKKNHDLQITAFYRSPFDIPQGKLHAMYGVDFGYKVSLWNNRASIGLRATDIFNTKRFSYFTDDSFVYDKGTSNWQSQNVYINFTYNFGSIQKMKRSRGSGGDFGGDMGM